MISGFIDKLMLGPFTKVSINALNQRQLKFLWTGLVLLLILVLFPPWFAYETAFGGHGAGEADFVGLHFILLSRYGIIGESPYSAVEIAYKLWLILVAVSLLLTVAGIIWFGRKGRMEKVF